MIAFLLLALAQIPAPDAADRASRALHEEFRAIGDRERRDLAALADRLRAARKAAEEKATRAAIDPPAEAGVTRFRPLGEVTPATRKADSPLPDEARAVRSRSASAYFAIAGKAAAPGVQRFALADRALRKVLERDPDHAEARRLLGFLPHQGGWATPHAVDLLTRGFVLHPTFDWVQADWVPHLDRGELPGKFSASGKPLEWLPADRADALRSDFARSWQIKTAPHFEIQTNVPLAEAIRFGRRLEGLHELFLSEFADVIGPEHLPLARRFRDRTMKPAATPKKFGVSYFASKGEYVEYLKRFQLDESISLGYYMPPWEARRFPRSTPRSYFFRDDENAIEAFETLYHEGSHQVLFETAGKANFDRNRGNFWVWEGLGTYFETLRTQEDGSILLGAPVGARMASARSTLAPGRGLVPIADFVAMDSVAFNSRDDDAVFRNYAQAEALAVFLLHGENGRYREAFLDYAADAYKGRATRLGSLSDALGVDFPTLDAQFLAFLKPSP